MQKNLKIICLKKAHSTQDICKECHWHQHLIIAVMKFGICGENYCRVSAKLACLPLVKLQKKNIIPIFISFISCSTVISELVILYMEHKTWCTNSQPFPKTGTDYTVNELQLHGDLQVYMKPVCMLPFFFCKVFLYSPS